MKVLFMGTPDFAAVSLEKLISSGYDVCGVFTQPDKPKSRGMKMDCSPVKKAALAAGLPVWQPVKLRDGTALEVIRSLAPDVIVVVAYGRILPRDILDVPRLGCINIHGSLLPKYRGSAPIQWAVLNGEKTTGVCSMYMAEEMDAGDVIFTAETSVGPEETSGELFDRLAPMGAELLVKTLCAIEAGTAPRTPQDPAQATFAPMITKQMCPIDWNRTSEEIGCQVRGLLPWPVATAAFGGTVFKVFEVCPGTKCGVPGTVLGCTQDGLEVACADGSLVITQLQAPGGRRMRAADYFRGHPLCI